MIDLSSHIEYLLLRHDCVVVPGLGAFLVHESPARYDENFGVFYPPVRSLGFNPAVTHNDGLLAESVARKERIGIETAMQNIQTEVSAFRHQLSQSGELPIGSLGVMSVGSEPDAILFEPTDDSAVSLRYAGFLPVSVRLLVEDFPEEATIETESDGGGRHTPILNLPLKIAASIISLFVLCGILYSTTNLVDSGVQNYASLDSGLSERVDVPGLMLNDDEGLPLSREIILTIARPVNEPSENGVVDGSSEHIGRYLLVVASFPTLKSAEKHIEYSGASDLSVIKMDDRYRVYVSSFDSQPEAYRQAEKLKDQYPSVWVCRR